jgi:hypothetical protein
MGQTNSNYEVDERAAIREFDASCPREKAEQLAAADVLERKGQQEIYERLQAQSSIESLQEKWHSTGERMRAETDPARKEKLFDEWMDLAAQINELRRES